jgi:hypothetical protein
MTALTEKVLLELKQYEHPLFVFDARPAAEGVEVLIQYSPPEPQVHTYVFLMRPREIESNQFPWIFQKQLYDCLHDFIPAIRSARTYDAPSPFRAKRT